MNAFEENNLSPGSSAMLNNMGGPRSRARTEKIKSSLFDIPGIGSTREMHMLDVPLEVVDIGNWLLALAHVLNWNTLEEALPHLDLPAGRWLIFPSQGSPAPFKSLLTRQLRSGIILSKCNKSHYCPDSPMIFTRSRLERKIEMVRINLNGYYEMD